MRSSRRSVPLADEYRVLTGNWPALPHGAAVLDPTSHRASPGSGTTAPDVHRALADRRREFAEVSAATDERLRPVSIWKRLLARPELGALAGTILVFAFFGSVAGQSGMFSAQGLVNFLEVAAQLGILASVAALLIIAGEFDLTVGSMIAFAGMVVAVPTVELNVPLWMSIVLAFAIAAFVGLVNGVLVVRTKLPSFIVTLAASSSCAD